MKTIHKEKILELRSQGHTYNEIKEILGCSKSTINYHCSKDGKEKTYERTRDYRETDVYTILKRKYDHFRRDEGKYYNNYKVFNEVIKEMIQNPICYLTGKKIDLLDKYSYNFDHKIPRSRGGEGSVENLGLCTRTINIAKHTLTDQEFIDMCRSVIEFNK